MTLNLRITVDPPNALLVFDKKQLRMAMRQSGNEVAAEARKLLRSAVGNGRVYRGSGSDKYRPYRPGHYRASAPGGAPVKVTGTLLRSIKTEIYRNGQRAIISSEFYGLFLEVGAKGGGKGKASRNLLRNGSNSRSRTLTTTSRVLEPRPFLSRALAAREASIARRLQAAVAGDLSFGKRGA